ncbi:MAG: HEAT repeat domain-containing protein, partial [bacterium]|nr:HEAT repeat domain-containing protein [bacterium]
MKRVTKRYTRMKMLALPGLILPVLLGYVFFDWSGSAYREEALQLIIRALEDDNNGIRIRAAGALGKIDREEVTAPLIQALTQRLYGYRLHDIVVDSLVNCRAKNKEELLLKALKKSRETAALLEGDESPGAAKKYLDSIQVFEGAARGLAECKSEAAVKTLFQALTAKSTVIRQTARSALFAIGPGKYLPILLMKMEAGNSNVRRKTAMMLGIFKDRKAFKVLSRALKDENYHVRIAAVHAIGTFRGGKAVKVLIRALKDENYRVRIAAARALGAYEDRKTINVFIQALKDENYDVRIAAVHALGAMGGKEVMEPLFFALRDGSTFKHRYLCLHSTPKFRVREAAAAALGRINSQQVIQPLIRALEDSQYSVRQKAACALGNIKALDAVEPLTQVLLLGRKLNWDDLQVTAIRALGNIRILGSDTLDILFHCLEDKNEKIREVAVYALGKTRNKLALEPLIRALKDTASHVRDAAAEVLG